MNHTERYEWLIFFKLAIVKVRKEQNVVGALLFGSGMLSSSGQACQRCKKRQWASVTECMFNSVAYRLSVVSHLHGAGRHAAASGDPEALAAARRRGGDGVGGGGCGPESATARPRRGVRGDRCARAAPVRARDGFVGRCGEVGCSGKKCQCDRAPACFPLAPRERESLRRCWG